MKHIVFVDGSLFSSNFAKAYPYVKAYPYAKDAEKNKVGKDPIVVGIPFQSVFCLPAEY